MDLQPIYNVAELCYRHGVTHAIISPGSRSAPLTLAFSRHPEIITRVIPDERNAAFIALGLAQSLKTPVVLICTSGSAVYNYAPAIAEAYFARVPLMVLSADRPPEWWGQQDGQTIYQDDIFGKHVSFSATVPVDLAHSDAQWHLYRTVSEAASVAQDERRPVHVNFPFREPFYPKPEVPTFFESSLKVPPFEATQRTIAKAALKEMESEWINRGNTLLVVGQSHFTSSELEALNQWTQRHSIPVVGDIIANTHNLDNSILGHDLILRTDRADLVDFSPDFLITMGGPLLSKSLKSFLRSKPNITHWHIGTHKEYIDAFQNVSRILTLSTEEFIIGISSFPVADDFAGQKQNNYLNHWKYESDNYTKKLNHLFEEPIALGEFEMVFRAMKNLPDNCNVHLANSMAVRYANYCGIAKDKSGIEVYSNRGACGIDGCTSTAVGVALADPDRLNILITGDMAFLYDRNAFWHNYLMNNLRIIVLNNHGGGIFRLINGPSQLPELEPFFETQQHLSARPVAEEFKFEYIHCSKRTQMENHLQDFLVTDKRAKILEIETKGPDNQSIMKIFRQMFTE